MANENSEMNENNGKFSPRSYDEIIETYGLKILKGGAGLAISPTGDLVVRDGDLQLGDERFDALSRLVRFWRFNDPTLRLLFDDVALAPQREKSLRDELDRTALSAMREQDFEEFHALNDEIGALGFGSAAYAGTIVVVLNNLLKRCWVLLGKPSGWYTCGPLIGGRTVGEILEAGAANFRHSDEWARTNPPTEQQLKSIRVIADVLGVSLAPDGSRHPFRRNVCPDLLRTLSGEDYEELNRKFFSFAHNMAEAS